jgi:hypothetical protein
MVDSATLKVHKDAQKVNIIQNAIPVTAEEAVAAALKKNKGWVGWLTPPEDGRILLAGKFALVPGHAYVLHLEEPAGGLLLSLQARR